MWIFEFGKTGDIVFFNQIPLYYEYFYLFTYNRRQFSVKTTFLMTINKLKVRLWKKIAADLRKDVFNPGQLYVAFSRVRS